jgi:hypothetical protein
MKTKFDGQVLPRRLPCTLQKHLSNYSRVSAQQRHASPGSSLLGSLGVALGEEQMLPTIDLAS